MSAKRAAKSTRKSLAAAEALASCTGLIKASLCQTRIKCGKPSCRCAKSKRFRHVVLTFTYKRNGKSMGLHVPKDMEAEARGAEGDYRKLKELVQRISDSNLKKFRLACARRASRRKIALMKAKSRVRR